MSLCPSCWRVRGGGGRKGDCVPRCCQGQVRSSPVQVLPRAPAGPPLTRPRRALRGRLGPLVPPPRSGSSTPRRPGVPHGRATVVGTTRVRFVAVVRRFRKRRKARRGASRLRGSSHGNPRVWTRRRTRGAAPSRELTRELLSAIASRGYGRVTVCPFSLVVEAPVSCGRVAGREELTPRSGVDDLLWRRARLLSTTLPTNMYLLFWPLAKMLRTSLQSICLTRKKKETRFCFRFLYILYCVERVQAAFIFYAYL